MTGDDVAALRHAHELFAGNTREASFDARLAPYDRLLARAADLNSAGGQAYYRAVVDRSRDDLRAAASVDAEVAATAHAARRDHAAAQALTRAVLDEARADNAVPDTPSHSVRRCAAGPRGCALSTPMCWRPVADRVGTARGGGQSAIGCATTAYACRRPAAERGSRCGPRCRGWAVPTSGERPAPISSTVPG